MEIPETAVIASQVLIVMITIVIVIIAMIIVLVMIIIIIAIVILVIIMVIIISCGFPVVKGEGQKDMETTGGLRASGRSGLSGGLV